jgi:hypothetical protein
LNTQKINAASLKYLLFNIAASTLCSHAAREKEKYSSPELANKKIANSQATPPNPPLKLTALLYLHIKPGNCYIACYICGNLQQGKDNEHFHPDR